MRIRQFFTRTTKKSGPRIPSSLKSKPVVARCRVKGDLKTALPQLLSFLPEEALPQIPEQKISIKPSFNSPDPFPATTDPEFLREVIGFWKDRGITDITVIESTGIQNPLSIEQTLALHGLASEKMVPLDMGPWCSVSIPESPLRRVKVACPALQAEYLIYLICLKTHQRARFSLGIKAAMGLIHPRDRIWIHLKRLEENVADINLAIRPDLIIVDGRKAMVTGGPEKGDIVEPGFLFASTDMIALDVECLKVLQSYKADNRLDCDPWQFDQVAQAARRGLGCRSEQEYEVRGDPL